MKSPDTLSAEIRAPSFALCAGIIALITLVRLIGQHLSLVDLYFDESQYWLGRNSPLSVISPSLP
jgi:hypothetical protein